MMQGACADDARNLGGDVKMLALRGPMRLWQGWPRASCVGMMMAGKSMGPWGCPGGAFSRGSWAG